MGRFFWEKIYAVLLSTDFVDFAIQNQQNRHLKNILSRRIPLRGKLPDAFPLASWRSWLITRRFFAPGRWSRQGPSKQWLYGPEN